MTSKADWRWCYDYPRMAAKEIDRLQSLVDSLSLRHAASLCNSNNSEGDKEEKEESTFPFMHPPRPYSSAFRKYWSISCDLGPDPHHHYSLYRGNEEIARFNKERIEWHDADTLQQLCNYLNLQEKEKEE